MVNLLVTIHVITGVLAIFAFLLVVVELLDPKEKTAKRVKAFALIGTILIFVSWVVGGYYYKRGRKPLDTQRCYGNKRTCFPVFAFFVDSCHWNNF